MLSDFLTIKEHLGTYKGKTITFVGDGRNNVSHSLLVTGAILGANINILAPESLQPAISVQKIAYDIAKESGSQLLITSNIEKGIVNSDVVYTDVWCSMGEEDALDERVKLLADYQVNQELMKSTGMGKLAHEKFNVDGLEVTDDVFRSPASKVFDQAENRMHTIKALIAVTCGNVH